MTAEALFPPAWMPPEGERLPAHWHPRAEGYQRHEPNDEKPVFGDVIVVRHVFGSWGAYKCRSFAGARLERHNEWLPWDRLDNRAYSTHLACILAVEFELANK